MASRVFTFPNLTPGKHRLPVGFQLTPDLAPDLLAVPVTPVIPPVVQTGDLITSQHENAVTQALNDLWTDVQYLDTNKLANPLTAKGDILTRDASAPKPLPVGANGQILTADSAQATGIKWATVNTASLGAVPTSRQIIAGAGMTGGGDLSADRTLTANVQTVFGRTGNVVLTSADIAGVAVPVARQVIAGTGMTGGGALSADVTLNADVATVFGRKGAVVAAAGDYTAAQVTNAVDVTGAYANPAWITALAWGKITGAPAILADPTTTLGDIIVRGASAVTRLGVGANGMVLTADSGQPLGVSWQTPTGGASGSQTPWLQDIQGNGYRLLNAGNIGVGTATIPLSSAIAGRAYLTIKGASDQAFIELATGAADADATNLGVLSFVDPLNSQTDKRLAAIIAARSGPTANNRGSYMNFFTRVDGGTAWAERMRIDNQGRVGIATASPSVLLDIFGANVPYGGQLRIAAPDYSQITFYNSGAPAVNGANLRGQLIYDHGTNRLQLINFAGGSYGPISLNPSGGNVGIGTASPNAKLSFGANAVVDLLHLYDNGSSNKYGFGIQASEMRLFADPAGAMTFGHMTYANAFTERMRIATSGNVCIGSTNPGQRLDVVGPSGAPAVGSSNTGIAWFRESAGNNGVNIGFLNGGYGWIQSQFIGGVAAYYPLALNPMGGNVGIGITGPTSLLHVNGGNINVSGGQYLQNGSPLSLGGVTTQNVVTASRALGTTYQNTTGKPMCVSVSAVQSGGSVILTANADSASTPNTQVATIQGASGAGVVMQLVFWVLPNNYYRVFINAGSPTLSIWTEWY